MIELRDVAGLAAGAVGVPGSRVFYIQARTDSAQLTVVVEKEQVALLAAEAVAFLDRIADDYPEDRAPVAPGGGELRDPGEPLFRARLIGLGFDPADGMVLLELHEHGNDDEEDEDDDEEEDGAGDSTGADDLSDEDGYLARIYAPRALVRAMATHGAAAVTAGRVACPLCDMPMDPAGHRCPRWN